MTNTETPADTFSITGATFIPKCHYCGDPLTSNEFDFESMGFFSSHSFCTYSTSQGRYAVIDPKKPEVHGGRRFNLANRCTDQAQDFCRWNANSIFIVRDLWTGETLSSWVSDSYGEDPRNADNLLRILGA